MGRLIVIGDGPTAEIFLHQVLRASFESPITVFGGTFLEESPHLYREYGLEIRPGVRVQDVDRHALVVIGEDGSRTTYDRLVLATGKHGLRPSGLQLRNGRLLVNHNFETSDGHVYAIGDCAEASDYAHRISMVWQARTLAAMLVGSVPQELPIGTEFTRIRQGKVLQFPAPPAAGVDEAITA